MSSIERPMEGTERQASALEHIANNLWLPAAAVAFGLDVFNQVYLQNFVHPTTELGKMFINNSGTFFTCGI